MLKRTRPILFAIWGAALAGTGLAQAPPPGALNGVSLAEGAGLAAQAQPPKKTGLLGGSAKLEYIFIVDDSGTTESVSLPKAVIGPDVEFDDVELHFGKEKPWRFCVTVDISDHNIRISDIYLLWNSQESHNGRLIPTKFNGFVLTFHGIAPITGVSINPETTVGAAEEGGSTLDEKAITFSTDQIIVNWANAKLSENSILSLDVKTGTKKGR